MTRTTETVDERARRLVEQEVLICLSSLISELGKVSSELDIEDEIQELNYREDFEEPVDEHLRGLDREELVQLLEAAGFQCYDHETDDELAAAYLEHLQAEDEMRSYAEDNRIEPYSLDVYEHWAVSSYLARKLQDQGESVVDMFNMNIWARCTTGQSIYMDGVMQRIAEDLLSD